MRMGEINDSIYTRCKKRVNSAAYGIGIVPTWIFDSQDTVTRRRLRIDVERMLRAINERFGWDFVKEFASA